VAVLTRLYQESATSLFYSCLSVFEFTRRDRHQALSRKIRTTIATTLMKPKLQKPQPHIDKKALIMAVYLPQYLAIALFTLPRTIAFLGVKASISDINKYYQQLNR
jgi:hypothetical protein